jgi:hypothetical protein
MKSNSEVTLKSNSKTTTTPPLKKRSVFSSMILPLFGGLFLGFLLSLVATFLYLTVIKGESIPEIIALVAGDGDDDEPEEEETPESEPDDEDEPEEETPAPAGFPTGEKRIAYIKDSNIWLVNNDGTDKYQITSDGDSINIRYGHLDWKAENILSYIKCTTNCKIYTRVLHAGAETVAVTPPPFTQSIDRFAWSNNATMVAYMIRKTDDSEALIMNKAGVETTLKAYGPIPGRGVGDDDGVDITFTPDDTKVSSFLTFTTSDPYILIFRTSDGSTLLSLAQMRFPTFNGNNSLYYKDSATHKIMYRDLSMPAPSAELGSFNGFYLKASPSGNFISYYTVPGNTELAYHDVAGSPAAITSAAYNAEWLDDNFLIAHKSFVYPDIGDLGNSALLKVKRTDGTKLTLDTGEMSDFAIED